MCKKITLLATFAFLLAMPFVSANIAAPFSEAIVLLFPLIVLVEGIVFWILAKKWLKVKLGFWKSVLLVLIANIATSLIGTAYSVFMYDLYIEYSLFMLLAFIASVLIEWGIYIPIFKMKMLKTIKISNKHLLLLSLYVNTASYLLMIIFVSP